jgi:2-desacetyl-2-hydroxyethyl bacteriochlorophyllide A dehydrogenase
VRSTALWFTGPRQASLRPAPVSGPGPSEVTVRAAKSLVSAGTEMLVYRGLAGDSDLKPPNVEGSFSFPIKYGYQIVGVVTAAGPDSGFEPGDRVFVRHPHQELFTTATHSTWVTKIPDAVSDTQAAFLNLARVALTANLDAVVRPGERALVIGQGVVGMLCGRLARRTAQVLIAVDPLPSRRERALAYGADAAVAPEDAQAAVADLTGGAGADVTFEASGSAAALQSTFALTAEYGTIAVLSYFGRTPVPLVLAPEFHWRRQVLISSNAGTRPRWTPERRTEAVLALLPSLGVDDLVSASVPFSSAPAAYQAIDQAPDTTLAVLLDYAEA